MIFARKINEIPDFYMIFARKMPEFYIISHRINFSRFFGEELGHVSGGHVWGVRAPSPPRLLRL